MLLVHNVYFQMVEKKNLIYPRGPFLGMGLDAMGKAQGIGRVQDAFPCKPSQLPTVVISVMMNTVSWCLGAGQRHHLVSNIPSMSWCLTPDWYQDYLLLPKGAHFPVGQYETDEMMPNSATLIPCHTPTGSLVFSHMFSHYFHSSWCHGCSHRWWLSLRHITSGSESALCTTAVLWEIMMILCSCPEDPVLLLQTASSVVRKADLYDSDYPPPPHLLTLGRW